MSVQIAPFPNGSVGPAQSEVGFSFFFEFEVVLGQLLAVGEVPHDVEEPVAHTSGEVGHLLLGASLQQNEVTELF